MKKLSVISILLLMIGFVSELLYLNTSSIFWSVKLWFIGIICLVAGSLGLLFAFLGKNKT